MNWIKFLVITTLLGSLTIHAQEEKEKEEAKTGSPFKGKTFIKNPLDLRDPFKRKVNKKSRAAIQPKNSNNTFFTNQLDSIENKPLESIKIVGILIGKERRAVAKVIGSNNSQIAPGGQQTAYDTNMVYYIKEGMKLGPNQAEVKAILPGGVVLAEKIRNVYDQDEYLETVIPLSGE